MREVDVSDDASSPRGLQGSKEHIEYLNDRIAAALVWRNREKRGTEARATYSRVVQRLKAERSAAIRAAMRREKEAK